MIVVPSSSFSFSFLWGKNRKKKKKGKENGDTSNILQESSPKFERENIYLVFHNHNILSIIILSTIYNGNPILVFIWAIYVASDPLTQVNVLIHSTVTAIHSARMNSSST